MRGLVEEPSRPKRRRAGGRRKLRAAVRTIDEIYEELTNVSVDAALAKVSGELAQRRALRGCDVQRYVASAWLDRRVRLMSDSIASVGGRAYRQPWTTAITVGQWETTRVEGARGTATFIAMETLSGKRGTFRNPRP